jgi:hypothetical protein
MFDIRVYVQKCKEKGGAATTSYYIILYGDVELVRKDIERHVFFSLTNIS